MPQPLPSNKENSLFRQLVKYYESKQHKKGLKAAEQILRKTPNHADTQAFKALCLNGLNLKEEAFALAKVALKNDMRSHVCWHVYGLLLRYEKNFEEAIKAYKFALKLEPDSAQILRDLALLQMQMRDFPGYIQSRKQMLQARPQLRQNWTAVAVAHHLAGELKEAENVLKTYEETLKSDPPKSDSEHSEAVLYRNTIIAEMGEVERALEHLEAIKKKNLDRTAVMELRAQYLLQLDRPSEAEQAYRDLLERNNEFREYYEGLEKAMGLERSDRNALRDMYASYAEKSERLDAARRIPLDFLQGDDFKAAADHYLLRMLRKGVPSTFNNVKALYVDPEKRQTIEKLAEGYETSTQQVNGNSYIQPNGDPTDRFEESVLYFLAQHYNYKLCRDLTKAMQYVDKLIQMSPQTYDYTMTKGRILKHQGNLVEAAKVMNEAREQDLKDRYINTKCAKYQLRNDDNEGAMDTMSKFTRNDTIGGTLGDLLDMQSLIFLTEDGEAYARQGKLGLALKRFHSVFDIFEIWQEDQFDFHSFSLRKGHIRAYVHMVRWEDTLREHPFYVRAAVDAIKIYLALYDKPHLSQDGLPANMDELDEAERKKALKKVKKEQEKLEREDAERIEAAKKAAAKKANASADGETKKVDTDPRGTKLLATAEPLEEAMKFLAPLIELGNESPDAQHMGFEVFIRRKKYILALRCILHAFAIDPEDPVAHEQAIRFRHTLSQLGASSSVAVSLMNETLPAPYNDPSASLSALNDNFLAAHSTSAPHTYAHAIARCALDGGSRPQAEEGVVSAAGQCQTLEQALQGIETLRRLESKRELVERFAAAARKRWPTAAVLEREAAR